MSDITDRLDRIADHHLARVDEVERAFRRSGRIAYMRCSLECIPQPRGVAAYEGFVEDAVRDLRRLADEYFADAERAAAAGLFADADARAAGLLADADALAAASGRLRHFAALAEDADRGRSSPMTADEALYAALLMDGLDAFYE